MRSTRRAAAIVLSMSATAALIGCAAGGGGGAGGGDAEPIKIAIIPPTSGTFAEMGEDLTQGWEYAVEEANDNGGVNGHPVELIVKDTDATVPTTTRAMTEAVNRDGAQFISGVMSSPEHVAVFQQANQLDVLALNHVGQADNLVGEACSPNGFTTVQSTAVNIEAMSQAMAEIPGKKWAFLNADFATGHDVAQAFKEQVESDGGEVVSDQFVPLGTTDFGAQITEIKASGADALLSTVYGADLVAFANQAEQYQLSDQVETVVGISSISENLFPAIGDKIQGWYGNLLYDVTAESPENEAFVKGYTEKYGEAPYYFPADAYIAAQALFAAIEESGSTDPLEVRDALEGLTFTSLNGEVTMRAEDHRLISPVYAARVVEGEDGAAWESFLEVPAADLQIPVDPACKIS